MPRMTHKSVMEFFETAPERDKLSMKRAALNRTIQWCLEHGEHDRVDGFMNQLREVEHEMHIKGWL